MSSNSSWKPEKCRRTSFGDQESEPERFKFSMLAPEMVRSWFCTISIPNQCTCYIDLLRIKRNRINVLYLSSLSTKNFEFLKRIFIYIFFMNQNLTYQPNNLIK